MYNYKITNFFKNLSFFVILFLANCSILLGLNYLVSNLELNNKYGMSSNVMSFNVVDSSLLNFNYILENENIRVIAETDNKSIIGLYDPSYYYYINANKIISPSEFRYFSSEDYTSNSNVSIYIEDLSEVLQNEDRFNIVDINNKYNTKIINILDKDSEIYADNIKLVKNLFSLEKSSIKKIYIDADDSFVSRKLDKSRLLKMGLEYIEPEKMDVFQVIKLILTDRKSVV